MLLFAEVAPAVALVSAQKMVVKSLSVSSLVFFVTPGCAKSQEMIEE